MNYNVVDLFSGAGGMSEGIIQAGLNIVFSSDINESVEKTYRNRHQQLGLIQGENTYFLRKDIKDLSGYEIFDAINNLTDITLNNNEIDAIFGGPPCQGFSRAGRRNSSDPRNLLFGEYVRVVNEVKPKYVVMENVEGFNDMQFFGYKGIHGDIYPDKSTTPEILTNEFIKIGYSVLNPRILNAHDYGVPQRRKRVIFIAYRNDVSKPKYPEKSNSNLSLDDAIGDLNRDLNYLSTYQKESIRGRTKTINGKYPEYRKIVLNNGDFPNHTPIVKERFSLYREGESSNELKNRINKKGIDLIDKPHLLNLLIDRTNLDKMDVIKIFKAGNIDKQYMDILLTKKNIRSKLDPNEPAPTVVTIPDDYISPYENRTFSVRELARLQSFDDSFQFLGKKTTGGLRRRVEVPQYTQVGNAVPPLLAKSIALEIKKALDRTYTN